MPVCKTLNYLPFAKFVPLVVLLLSVCSCSIFALCFLVPSLRAMVLPLRYARAMTQQGRGELKAGRGKSPRGAVLEDSPLSIQADHGEQDRKRLLRGGERAQD